MAYQAMSARRRESPWQQVMQPVTDAAIGVSILRDDAGVQFGPMTDAAIATDPHDLIPAASRRRLTV